MQPTGKNILITGATGGIGLQTAISLAKTGARVMISGRNQARGQAAVDEIKRASGNHQVELYLADVSLQKDVHALADQVGQQVNHLDALINNAGLASPQRTLTEDGIESNFAVNVLAPFLLTRRLMDCLKSSPAARVINLTGGEASGTIDLGNLQAERSFDGLNSYSHSKLIMMALSYEFALRLSETTISMNVCYPGQASTNMTRSVTTDMLPGFLRLVWPLFKSFLREDGGKSAEKASRSSVYLATSPEVAGLSGKYFDTNSKMSPWPKPVLDPATRQAIWALAEKSILPA